MSTQTYFEGFAAGVRAFRPVPPHDIPHIHPHGSGQDGFDWFLGCARGLEQCALSLRYSIFPAPGRTVANVPKQCLPEWDKSNNPEPGILS